MRLFVRLISKWHPRGLVLEPELPDGASVTQLKEHILVLPETAGCGSELFRGLVCVVNGMTVPDEARLQNGDRITFWKPISGG